MKPDGAERLLPLFRAYLRCLVGTMAAGVALALGLTAAQAWGEAAGFMLLVPLLGSVGFDISGGAVGSLAGYVRRVFSWVGLQPTLGVVLVVYVGIISLQALVTQWQMTAVLGLERRFVTTLRKRLYTAIARANWGYLARTRATDVAHVLTEELERVGVLTYQVLSLVSNTIVAIVYLAFAARLSPTMTALACGSGAALLIALRRKVNAVRIAGEALTRARGRVFTAAIDHVAALRTAKSHGIEQRHIDSFGAATDELAAADIQAARMHAGSRTRFDVGAVTALALMLYVGIVTFGLSAAGTLLLLYIFARTMPRVSTLQQAAHHVAHHLASFRAFARLQAAADAHSEAPPLASADVVFRERISLEGLTFAHAESPVAAIRNVALEIPFGAVTAIVGPSGAGKSTLADLLAGLHRPQDGRILIDGVPLDSSMLPSWKRQIGYVDQDAFFFNDTVRANLWWAHPGATDLEVRDALTLAAAEFVFELPDGLETVLGDRGIRLSGGERQRLALARAMLRKPGLLLLDEATSALDAENESRILDAIRRLRGTTTVVLITHRLSAVRDADIIYVLENGGLVESGDWITLNRHGGRFQALCDSQGVAAAYGPGPQLVR